MKHKSSKSSKFSDSRNLICFDFDGTITPYPGGKSALFRKGGSRLVVDDLQATYKAMKSIYASIYDDKGAKARIYDFFAALSRCERTTLTIQSNNYEEIVLSFLRYELGLDLGWFDLDRSTFREHCYVKSVTIASLARKVDSTIYYFEDDAESIRDAQHEGKPRILHIVNCYNGTRNLNVLLTECPVKTQDDVDVFLKAFISCE